MLALMSHNKNAKLTKSLYDYIAEFKCNILTRDIILDTAVHAIITYIYSWCRWDASEKRLLFATRRLSRHFDYFGKYWQCLDNTIRRHSANNLAALAYSITAGLIVLRACRISLHIPPFRINIRCMDIQRDRTPICVHLPRRERNHKNLNRRGHEKKEYMAFVRGRAIWHTPISQQLYVL